MNTKLGIVTGIKRAKYFDGIILQLKEEFTNNTVNIFLEYADRKKTTMLLTSQLGVKNIPLKYNKLLSFVAEHKPVLAYDIYSDGTTRLSLGYSSDQHVPAVPTTLYAGIVQQIIDRRKVVKVIIDDTVYHVDVYTDESVDKDQIVPLLFTWQQGWRIYK